MTEKLILVPAAVWSTMLYEFSRQEGGVERVAYLDGFTVDRTGFPPAALPGSRVAVVSSPVLPDATLTPGNYQVSAAAMSQAGSHLRPFGMTRLIQVHTHGSDWTDHSDTDDSRAYSQRLGSLSIVLPRHGRDSPNLSDCGVHLRVEAGWRRIPQQQLDTYVRLLPSVYDFRDTTCLTPKATPNTGIFSRLVAWMRGQLRRTQRE